MTTRTIHKYALDVTDEQAIEVSAGFKPLAVAPGSSIDTILLWAEVDPWSHADEHALPITHSQMIYVVGTGHPIPEYARHYVGTVQMPPFVWHVYTTGS